MELSLADIESLEDDVLASCKILFRENFWEFSGEGHPSARIGTSNKFITIGHLHPAGHGMGDATSKDDLIVLDTELNRISGKYEPMTEAVIHALIYKTRPDVSGIVYAHPPMADCFAAINEPIPSYSKVSIWNSDGAVIDHERAAKLLDKLGKSPAILLQNPSSLVTTGPSVRDAVVMVYDIEKKAARDYRTIILGRALKGDSFLYHSSYYMSEEQRRTVGNVVPSEKYGIYVRHMDYWRYLCDKNL